MPKESQPNSIDLLNPYRKSLKWIVLALSFLVYANTLKHEMALDDYSIIVNHSHVQNGWEGINKILTTNYRNGQDGFNDGLYRPLSLVSFAIEKELFDNNTSIAHFINCLLYAFSCLLLWLSLSKLLRAFPLIIPLAATLLFCLHPIHTEVVANIKGRDELFAFLGFSLSLYFILKYLSSVKLTFIFASIPAFLFALFSKESAVSYVVLIPTLLLLDKEISLKRTLSIAVGLLPLALGFYFLRSYIIESMPNAVDPGNFGLLNNPISATTDASLKWGSTFALQLTFLHQLFVPIHLLHDYSFEQLPLQKMNSIQALVGLFILIGLITSSIWGVLKRNALGLIAAFYLGSIAVASQLFVTIGVQFAERMLFNSVLAFALFAAIGTYSIYKKKVDFLPKKKQVHLAVLFGFVAVLYSFKTFDRNQDWKNNLSLYSADIERGHKSARINYNYGTELNEQAQNQQINGEKNKLAEQAIIYLSRAINIYPDYKDAYNNLGLTYKIKGDYKNAVAVFKACIERDPNYSKAFYNLATSLAADQQYEQAMIYMDRFVSMRPNYSNAYFLLGQYAGNLQRFEDAANYMQQVISIDPSSVDAHNFLGMALGNLGKHAEAEISFGNALQYAPNNTTILLNLVYCYHHLGKSQQKVQTLNRILQIDPNHQQARSLLQQ